MGTSARDVAACLGMWVWSFELYRCLGFPLIHQFGVGSSGVWPQDIIAIINLHGQIISDSPGGSVYSLEPNSRKRLQPETSTKSGTNAVGAGLLCKRCSGCMDKVTLYCVEQPKGPKITST